MNAQNIHYLRTYNFECLRLLGKGAFSEVILAQHIISKHFYAIKIISHKKSSYNQIQQEVNILKSLSHHNIIRYYKAFLCEDITFLVMEYIPSGNIQQNLPQTEEQKRVFFKHLILAVQYLHQNNIIHCDLKFQNILIADPGDYTTIKIIDFGLAFQFQQYQEKQYILSKSRQYGTPNFMAPELFNNAIYSKEIDIWSCGIILYILEFGEHPFLEKHEALSAIKQKLKKPIFKNLCTETNEKHEFYVCELIKKMTKIEPEERYTLKQILRHPWVTHNTNYMQLTAYQIRQAFMKKDNIKNIVYALLLIKYIAFINKINTSQTKFQIQIKKIQTIKRKPTSFHEIVQQMLRDHQLTARNYATSLSPPSEPNNEKDQQTKNQKNSENKIKIDKKKILKLLQNPNYIKSEKLIIKQKKNSATNSLADSQHICRKSFQQQRLKNCSQIKINFGSKQQKRHSSFDAQTNIANSVNLNSSQQKIGKVKQELNSLEKYPSYNQKKYSKETFYITEQNYQFTTDQNFK